MASRLVDATTAKLRCGTGTAGPVNWKRETVVPSICRVCVSHSLLPSSSKRISNLILGPKIAKVCRTRVSAQGAADMETATASDKWTIPNSKGVGYETVVQVTPRDVWYWQADTHWKHWQGFWINYTPEKTKEVVKEYKSVRSLQIVDSERTKLYHRNQWYDAKGFGKDQNWEYGPWNMTLKDHALHDGILHPNSPIHRILLMPSGNLGWIQMYLQPDNPRSVIFSEPMFYVNPKQRISVPVGYDAEGNIGVALLLEEVKDTEERMDSSWSGTLWKHTRDPLVDTRDEPKGTFQGHEESISPKLEWMMREAVWQGFKGGLSEEEAKNYMLIHMPNNVTIFAPRKAAVGKDFAFYITYVETDTRVRIMSVAYGADLNLKYIKSGVYDKVVE